MKKRPVLVLTLSALLGTFFGFYQTIAWSTYLIIASIFLLALLATRSLWQQIIVFFTISFLLCAAAIQYEKDCYDHELSLLPAHEQLHQGCIVDAWPRSGSEVQLLVQSEGFTINLFLKDAAAALAPKPGQTISFKTPLKPMEKPLSPIHFNAYRYGLSHHLHASGIISDPHNIALFTHDASVLSTFRHELRQRISAWLSPHQSALLLALILGESAQFAPEQKNIYQSIGAQHLLAVSGLQITLLSWLCFIVLRFLFASLLPTAKMHHSYLLASLFTLCLLWGFVLLCHCPRSAVRAALMSSVLFSSHIFARKIDLIDALLASAFLALLIDPLSIGDIGFLLSHAACWGLLLSAQCSRDLSMRIKSYSSLAALFFTWLIASTGAFLATLPITTLLFGTFAPSSLLANWLLAPLAAFLQIPAIVGGIFGALFTTKWLLLSAAWCASLIELFAEFLSEHIGGLTSFPFLSPWQLFIVGAASFLLFLSALARKKIGCIIAICTLLLPLPPLLFSSEGTLRMIVMPVGQGDASILLMPSGHSMLIDAGGNFSHDYDPGEKIVVPRLKRLGLKKIDFLVISHPDADHLKGAFAVLKSFPVKEIWHSGFREDHPLTKELLTIAHEKNIIVKDTRALLGKHQFEETTVEILAPNTHSEKPYFPELSANDNSLVLRISYHDRALLWPGDVEEEGESRLLSASNNLKSAIVKAPHHGSKTSSTEAFIARTNPQFVIFSTGKNNRFSFPHEEVRERYKKYGAQSFTTHSDGEISIEITEKGIDIAPFISGCHNSLRTFCS